jgi:hypothetical protein
MILSKGNFLALTNENVATKISERQPSIEQFFVFNLVSFGLRIADDEILSLT